MSNKKFFFMLSAVLFTLVLNGQSLINPDIQAKLDAFVEHSNAGQWDLAFDLLYPKLFKNVAKEELISMMAQDADGMTIVRNNTRITSTSRPVEDAGETFVRIEYSSDVTIQIKPEGMYDYPKSLFALEQQFNNTYGPENVSYDQDRKIFSIAARTSMMAVDTGKGNWTLVEINMDQPGLMESIFSPAIIDALVKS